jgi:hypothetical protein
MERGVATHAVSADKGDRDGPDEDTGSQGEGGWDELTEEEVTAAKVVPDDPSFDLEGLVLTGGDW